MCGRFYDIHDLDDITSRFRVDRPRDLSLPVRYNVAPSQSVPVIRVMDDKRELTLMRWGLIPHWAKDEKIGYKMINARAETVREKPSFRDAYASRRLIVPVSGFYEWKRKGTHKQPFAIRHPDKSPLAFAGLWETWQDLDTFTIVTTAANAAMRPVHDRMPLILDDEQIEQWLDPDNPDPEAVLTAVSDDELELVPVSDWVNNARHEGSRHRTDSDSR
jgi:putative SOS response-associated peptidase YedK